MDPYDQASSCIGKASLGDFRDLEKATSETGKYERRSRPDPGHKKVPCTTKETSAHFP